MQSAKWAEGTVHNIFIRPTFRLPAHQKLSGGET